MNNQSRLENYSSNQNNWQSFKISDIIDVNDYPSLEKGVPQTYVAMDDIEIDKRKITGKRQKEYKYSAPRFKNGDTLYPKMSRCLQNGKTAFVDVLDEDEVAFGSTEFLVLRPSENDLILPKFIYYTMRRPEIVALTYKWRNGTTARRQRIPKDVFDYIEIELPPKPVQEKILTVLDSLDSKIESNDKLHHLQLELLQAKFSSWFDVHIDEEEEFNGDTCKLSDFAELKRITVDPSESPNELWELYSFEAHDQRKYPFLIQGSDIESAKYKLPEECILISKLNPRIKRIWKPEETNKRSICSTEFLVIVPKKKSHTGFLWGLLNSDIFTEFMKSHTTGTSNSHQRVKPDDVMGYEFKSPNQRAIKRFQEFTEFIHLNNYTIKKQNRLLEQLRDTVLPGLMSGEIRVNNINLENLGVSNEV